MKFSRLLTLLALIVAVIYGIISAIKLSRETWRCKHGVFHGAKRKGNVCKCSLCEEERQLAISNMLLRKEKEQKRRESEKKYRELKNKAWIRYNSRLPYRQSSIDNMSGFKFEDYCAKLLKRMGYTVHQTKKTGDGGKDAIAWKNNKKYMVECKHYKGDQKIDRPTMQKLFAAMNEENADGGIFIATCSYTKEALEYGAKYNIQTIDRESLLALAKDCETESDHDTTYELCCPVCGETVYFDFFSDSLVKSCSKQHQVPSMFSKKGPDQYNYHERGLMI